MSTFKSRLKSWASDGPLRNVARFGVTAMVGQFGASIFGFATMIILARGLSVKAFGTLAIIRAYVYLVDYAVNFQSWQGFIKFGNDALANNDDDAFLDLVKFTFFLDVGTALLGAMVAVAGAELAALVFRWETDTVWLVRVYATGVAFRISGISVGIFRLFDLFRSQAVLNTLSGAIIAAGLLLAAVGGLTLDRAVYALVLGESLGFVVTVCAAIIALRKRGFARWFKASARQAPNRFRHLWSFFIATNLQGSVKKVQSDADIAVVGAVLGDEPAGLFRIAKQVSLMPAKLINPFNQVVFTELAKHVSSGDSVAHRRFLKRIVAIMAAAGVAAWTIGSLLSEQLIGWTVGSNYIDAAPVLVVCLAGIALSFVAIPLQRALVAKGQPGVVLRITTTTTFFYLTLVVWMTFKFGVLGAAGAFFVQALSFTLWLAKVNME